MSTVRRIGKTYPPAPTMVILVLALGIKLNVCAYCLGVSVGCGVGAATGSVTTSRGWVCAGLGDGAVSGGVVTDTGVLAGVGVGAGFCSARNCERSLSIGSKTYFATR